ncbi:sugar ABC transporter substrate-binding protein [Vibrio mangrovi]|nr:sugar ABC transporter substrate-binding protein [Vibrio mangrovi]MDW6002277.1 sugar ABC transporter substrate-binding protein [Vibrio mangrovi]
MSNDDNFLNIIATNIEAAIDERGDDVYLDYAYWDFDTQLAQIKSFVKVGVDAIIVVAVSGDEKYNQQLIQAAGRTPIVFVNNEPFADLSKLPEDVVYVGADEAMSGTMEMEALAKLANYQGRVALLVGAADHPAAKMRTQDVKDVLAKYPGMELVVSQVGNWQRNQGYKIVTNWVAQKIDFNILVSNNDEMVIGGMMALQDAKLNVKSYFTGGIDATQDALKEMEKGNLDVTVLQDAVAQARGSVDVSYKLMARQHVESPYWIPFRLITPENYKQLLNN